MITANAAEFFNWIARNKPGNDGWGVIVNRKAMSLFEKTMVNKCHAKRDTKTCSSVTILLILNVLWLLNALLSFRFTIALSFVILAGRRESRRAA